jgi:4,5-DOPA dioxygenase extradiol
MAGSDRVLDPNDSKVDWNNPHGAYNWAVEFDAKVMAAVEAHDTDALAHPQRWGKTLFNTAHPTAEHYLPLLYCIGSTDENEEILYPYEGFDFGSISMRAILFGESSRNSVPESHPRSVR